MYGPLSVVMPNLGLIDNINVIHPNFVALSVKRPAMPFLEQMTNY